MLPNIKTIRVYQDEILFLHKKHLLVGPSLFTQNPSPSELENVNLVLYNNSTLEPIRKRIVGRDITSIGGLYFDGGAGYLLSSKSDNHISGHLELTCLVEDESFSTPGETFSEARFPEGEIYSLTSGSFLSLAYRSSNGLFDEPSLRFPRNTSSAIPPVPPGAQIRTYINAGRGSTVRPIWGLNASGSVASQFPSSFLLKEVVPDYGTNTWSCVNGGTKIIEPDTISNDTNTEVSFTTPDDLRTGSYYAFSVVVDNDHAAIISYRVFKT